MIGKLKPMIGDDHLKKYIVYAIVLIAAIGIIFTFIKKDNGAMEVTVYKASRADLEKSIDLSGTIEAVDYEEITFATGSKVLKVYASENQLVEKGQVLAELDTGDIAYKLDKLRINEKQLQQELAELRNPSTVSAILSTKNKVAKAESAYSNIDRKLKEMNDKVVKAETLYQAGAVAESDYKAQVSARDDLAEQLAQAKIELNNAENELLDYDRNKSLDIQTKSRQIASNEADIKNLEKQLGDTIVKSSSSGTLVEFPLKEGRYVEQADVIKIYDMSQLNFKGRLTQEDTVQVKQGQHAAVKLKGLDKEYSAEVYAIKRYAMLDKDSASLSPKVEVELKFLDADELLSVGFEADAVIMVGESDGTLSIPREAVRKSEKGQSTIFLVNEGIANSTVVTTGIFDDYMIEIKSGVSEEDLVVVNPPKALMDGDHVSINLK